MRWVATAALAAAVLAASADARPRALSVGVALPVWDYAADERPRPVVLAKMRAAGIGWVRIDVGWCALEPRAGWIDEGYAARVDRTLAEARTHALRVLIVWWCAPSWATGNRWIGTAPRDLSDWCRASAYAARRWRADAWEVWNEPDYDLFLRGASPETYGRMLAAVYPVFEATGATVLHGGLAHLDPRWLRRSIRAGARFDALAAHPYPLRHDGTASRALARLDPIRRVTRKPVWITELGWSSYSGGVGEVEQGRRLVEALRLVRDRYGYVERVFVFEARDTGTRDVWLDRLGLLRRDLSEKPAYRAVAAYLSRNR